MGNTPSSRFSSLSTNFKMVFLVRNDLTMGKGKAAAQCAHAALACYKRANHQSPEWLKKWETFGQAKVALKVHDYPTMLELKRKADQMGLTTCIVHDAGRTQVEEGTATVLGIGPGPAEVIDEVSGHLKLL